MKVESKRGAAKFQDDQIDAPQQLVEAYNRIFVSPSPQLPSRARLSKYKTVQSITTYGIYDGTVKL